MVKNIFKRGFQIIALIFLVLMIIVGIVGAMLGISFVKIMEAAPKINPKTILLDLNENSKIVDQNNNVIDSLATNEYRELVKISEVPKALKDAFISIEDERFESHKGIDLIGIGKSFLDNLSAGDIVRGGSTITQQLVKNVYLTDEVKWERKINEIYLALEVEKALSKDEILEAYMNRVYLGQHAYGVKVAAYTYFSKDVKDLSIAECATIAGIAQAPSSFSLFYSYYPGFVPEGAKELGTFYASGEKFIAVLNEAARERASIVLYKMHKLGKITDAEYEKASKEDVFAAIKPGSFKKKEYSNHIADLIKQQTAKAIMESQKMSEAEAYNLMYTGGLTIKTTIDWDMQKKLEETYDNFSNFFRNTTENGGPILASLNLDEYGDIVDVNSNKVYYKKENLINESGNYYVPNGFYSLSDKGDLTIKSSRFYLNGDYIVVKNYYTINDQNNLVTYRTGNINIPADHTKAIEGGFTIKSSYLEKQKDFYSIDKNQNLVINNKYYTYETIGTIQPQSATMIVDNKSGEIKAMVAARGQSEDDTIDRATNFNRSPASAIKPLVVYTPALENGYTLASGLDDTPYDLLEGTPWPVNVYGSYLGMLNLKTAIMNSTNTTAVKVLNDIGINKGVEYLERFGIINSKDPENDNFVTRKEDSRNNDENVSLALGGMSYGLTVYDMVQAYTAFPNNGNRKEISIISSIDSEKLGNIYTNPKKDIKVMSPQTAFLMNVAMTDTVNQDYMSGAWNDLGIQTAGKTGTSNNSKDFWFAGYNPYFTAVTWIGFDNNNIEMTGNSVQASDFYGQYANKILAGKKAASFEKPVGIVQAQVSALDGLLPTEYTSQDPRGNMIITEYFAEGTVPTEYSQTHVKVTLDKRNNLLARKDMPKWVTTEKVFITRTKPYTPGNFNGIIPDDWRYMVPTKYSDLEVKETTETKKLSDGTIITITQKINGDIVTTTTKPDGSKIIETKTPDGNVTTETIAAPKKDPEKPNNGNSSSSDSGSGSNSGSGNSNSGTKPGSGNSTNP